jgi:hypothetical protein
MNLKPEIKKASTYLSLMLLFLILGLLSVSLFYDEVLIGFNWGYSNNWTYGWNFDWDWVGGLGNLSLLIGFIFGISSLVCFFGFVTTLNKIISKISLDR